MQVVAEGEDIVYTYDVYWQEVGIEWSRRWDAYLRGPASAPEIQWFSVLNSLCTVLVLSMMVAIIFLRTVCRDIAKYKVLRRVVQGKVWAHLNSHDLLTGQLMSRSARQLPMCRSAPRPPCQRL